MGEDAGSPGSVRQRIAQGMSRRRIDLDGWPTLPADGQAISWQKQAGGPWQAGVVAFVWLCLDEPAIRLTTGETLFPGFGDAWAPACEGESMMSTQEEEDHARARVAALTERVCALTDELAEMTANYARACSTIALMHEAATGRQDEGPQQGVVEDVAAVRARMLVAEQRVLEMGTRLRALDNVEGIVAQQKALAAAREHAARGSARTLTLLVHALAALDACEQAP